jgi:hypothetical protein
MIYLVIYIFIYCNIDILLNKFYLLNYTSILDNELIKNNYYFYNSIIHFNFFNLCIYSIYIIKNIIYYHSINNYSIALGLIYTKYILNIFLIDNITISQYEFSKNIMWLFTTPLMLKMYCDMNNLKLYNIKIQYHI